MHEGKGAQTTRFPEAQGPCGTNVRIRGTYSHGEEKENLIEVHEQLRRVVLQVA